MPGFARALARTISVNCAWLESTPIACVDAARPDGSGAPAGAITKPSWSRMSLADMARVFELATSRRTASSGMPLAILDVPLRTPCSSRIPERAVVAGVARKSSRQFAKETTRRSKILGREGERPGRENSQLRRWNICGDSVL